MAEGVTKSSEESTGCREGTGGRILPVYTISDETEGKIYKMSEEAVG